MAANHKYAFRIVDCPTCEVKAGDKCKTKDGDARPWPHKARCDLFDTTVMHIERYVALRNSSMESA